MTNLCDDHTWAGEGDCPKCERDSWKPPTVPCGLCGKPTQMTGTRRCDMCWELEGRIQRDPDMAKRILADLAPPTYDRISPWVPITDLRTLKAMGKATEELGECTSAIARCLIQGLDATEPDTGKINRAWLEEEIADVRAMLDELEQDLNLDGPRMAARTARKRAAQRRWKDML